MSGSIDYFDCPKCGEQATREQDHTTCEITTSCSKCDWRGEDIDNNDNEKQCFNCFNYCPKCNAGENDIEWGDKEWGGNSAWQDATCNKCGCEFQEVYEYKFTEIKE
ncbi:MAG: hypothetical protein DRP55_07750 [Spirochaetes bacterium]|nr:MAG: hypothetical protein DRP55_07750 [Spirochaetota bacterium]